MFVQADAVAFGSAHFGAGSGSIHFDNVGCTGSETRLIDCPRSSTVYCRYAHSEDAGVRCQGLEKWCNDFTVAVQMYESLLYMNHYFLYSDI